MKFQGSVLAKKEATRRKEKTNMEIMTDAEKSMTKTPFIELVGGPCTTSEKDAP